MQDRPTWLVPDYYDTFHCKGGACRQSCCMGWGISVSMEEYFRLIGLDCSPELHHRLECAFHLADSPSPERYALVSPSWLGDCPMHDKDGLCMLHRECGEGALPAICRLYPRRMEQEGTLFKGMCSNSCEAVVELLAGHDHQLVIRREALDAQAAINQTANPLLPDLGAACLRLVQNRAIALPERLRRIGRFLKCDAAQDIAGEMCAPDLHIIPDMLSSMYDTSPSLRHYGEGILTRYAPESAALYAADCRHFSEVVPHWERIFENLLFNHIFYADFPFVDSRVTPDGAYISLVGLYAVLRVMCVGYMAGRHEFSDFVDVAAGMFRFIEHTSFYYNAHALLMPVLEADPGAIDSLLAL